MGDWALVTEEMRQCGHTEVRESNGGKPGAYAEIDFTSEFVVSNHDTYHKPNPNRPSRRQTKVCQPWF